MSFEWFAVRFGDGTAQAKVAAVQPVVVRSFGEEEAQHHICFDVQSQDGTTKIVRLVIADKFLTDWNQRAGFDLTDDLSLMTRLFELRCARTVPVSELVVFPKDLEELLSPAA